MSKDVKAYRQCGLVRQLENGSEHTTSWIPECFAEVGETLKLRGVNGWVDGWKVVTASHPMDAKTVEANSRSHLHQREASDI
jgi:hypothetical protein